LAASAGSGSVALTWAAPASDGGAAITGYNVYRGISAGGESSTPLASNVTGRSFTDTTVADGTAYFYTVTAVNGMGVSAKSAEASATPQQTSIAAFVRRVGSATASSSKTTISVLAAPPALPPVTH
jgi:fibronectin type 3 domain-containing protein